MNVEIGVAERDLTAAGYVQVESWEKRDGTSLAVGQRVHHVGDEYLEALRDGTATILSVWHKPQSSWEKRYGHPDVEVLVATTRDGDGVERLGRWADYHTKAVTP